MNDFQTLRHDIASLVRDSAGNVAIIFCLTLTVLVGGAGAAIDYMRLYDQKTAYAVAADAAILAALASASDAEAKGKGNVAELAEDAALKAWEANIVHAGYQPTKAPRIVIKKVGIDWSAEIDYKERLPTTFISAIGITGLKLEGGAQASTSIADHLEYWDIHVAVDDSSSMGIGATQADMDNLSSDPGINCAFACHWADYAKGETDSASKAKAAGYKLRIDVVDEAVDVMMTDMKAANTASNVRGALWGLNDTAVPLVPLTTRLNDVMSYDIQLYKTPVSVGNTNYRAAMEKLTAEVGKSGGGKSSVDPRKALFIVTDGIHDTGTWEGNVQYVAYADHQMGTIDPEFCDKLKSDGVLIGVLYIDYITPDGFDGWIDPYKADVLPHLQSCASDNMFYNATAPEAIKTAMKDMLATAFGTGNIRLTN